MQECNTTEDPVLDAALATVLDFGVRRATLTEVARRAGVSRMTVYRRYADASELIRALMSREFGVVLARAEADADAVDEPRGRVVAGVLGTVERLMEHPLLLRLLELEPDAVVPYLVERVGEFQGHARLALATWIARAQEEAAVRAGDPGVIAATIELAARGLVVATRSLAPAERSAGTRELGLMIEAYLRPAQE